MFSPSKRVTQVYSHNYGYSERSIDSLVIALTPHQPMSPPTKTKSPDKTLGAGGIEIDLEIHHYWCMQGHA